MCEGWNFMLLQTNSYIVPKDKRTEHARLVKKFRQVMSRLGCDDFEVHEQAGPDWSTEVGGRFVQIMKFRDRDHQKLIRDAEQSDPVAQEMVREFCELINFPYQHAQGLATTAFYLGVITSVNADKLSGNVKPDRRIIPPGVDKGTFDATSETHDLVNERPRLVEEHLQDDAADVDVDSDVAESDRFPSPASNGSAEHK